MNEYKIIKFSPNSEPSHLQKALNSGWLLYKVNETDQMIVYILWRPIVNQKAEQKSWMKTSEEKAHDNDVKRLLINTVQKQPI